MKILREEIVNFLKWVDGENHDKISTDYLIKKYFEEKGLNVQDSCEHRTSSGWGRLYTCLECGHEWIKDSYDD